MNHINEPGARVIKNWASVLEDQALEQAKNISRLPFIAKEGVALMPDAHAGKGSTVGTVIATEKAIIPAAVGVDLGCGAAALKLSLRASDLPDNLRDLRLQLERDIPMGTGGSFKRDCDISESLEYMPCPDDQTVGILQKYKVWPGLERLGSQVGTLGSGNHFIELCLDENQDVWIMLHSGSRGIGNKIGTAFIDAAKRDMERFFIHLPDQDLAYHAEGTDVFDDYVKAVGWAQNYAMANRQRMMDLTLAALKRHIPVDFVPSVTAINCHHNYIEKENHFGRNMWVTRKGAIRAREGDLGIIPGSMGQRSYIVRGKGNAHSYCSCSHGAGRTMSRAAARRNFSLVDLVNQTQGVECRKDDSVLDEIPGAYKNIDQVMADQIDLVEVVHTLKQVMCVKGG